MAITQLMMGYKASGVAPAVVTVTPDPSDGLSATPGQASTNGTAVVVGGVGPFTYLWTVTSGGAGCTLTNATSATCTITTNTGLPQTRIGTWNVDVTDTGNGGLVSSDTGSFSLEVI